MPPATHALYIDWNNDGDFADVGEDVSVDLLQASVSRGFSAPLARMATTGRATFTLANLTRQYSPELVANARPRRAVKFDLTYSGVTVTLFRGFVQSITPTPGRKGDLTVQITAYDAIGLLDVDERALALATGVTADAIISAAVSAVYTPPATAYASGVSVFPFSSDRWAGDALGRETVSAARKIEEACAADWGRFFVSKAGAPTYQNRHASLSQATALTVADTLSGLDYQLGEDGIYNVVEITCHPRVVGETLEVLGRIDRPVRLEASAAQTVTIAFRDQAAKGEALGGLNSVTPVAGTDLTATDDEAGQGADATASVTTSLTAYGDRAEVTLTNGSAAVVWVQTCQVRGYALRVRAPVKISVEDAASIAAYDRRKLSLNLTLMNSEADAGALAAYLLVRSQAPRATLRRLVLDGERDATFMAAVRDLELLDKLVVTEYQTGLSNYAGLIYAMQLDVTPGRHVLTVDLEQLYDPGTPFRLDTSALNSTHVLIY